MSLLKKTLLKRYNIYVLDTENPDTSPIDDAYNSIMDYESKRTYILQVTL